MKHHSLPPDLPQGETFSFPCVRLFVFPALLSLGALGVFGQVASPTISAQERSNEETLILSPFEVTASSDVGYEATETLSGSRMNMQLKDVASQVHVMTKEFMDDLGIVNLQDAMGYSMNMQGRDLNFDATNGNAGFEDTTGGPTAGGVGRVRSLATPNFSQDFFDTFIRSDNYNIERYTFSNGPNAILFGNSSPSGTFHVARPDTNGPSHGGSCGGCLGGAMTPGSGVVAAEVARQQA